MQFVGPWSLVPIARAMENRPCDGDVENIHECQGDRVVIFNQTVVYGTGRDTISVARRMISQRGPENGGI
jgi:hypothetical protein